MVESSAVVAFIVMLSVVVVFLGLVSGKFWYQNRSLKRRIEYYIGVLDMVKRHVDFAIFSDQTTELKESHQSEEETNSQQTPGTPGGEGVQAKTLQPLSGHPSGYKELETSASVPPPPQQPSIAQQSEDGRREEEKEEEDGAMNEYSVLSRTESQGLQTLRRAADYLEMTLQDPSLSLESSTYTPLVWLKRKRSKPKERQDNRVLLFGQRIDCRRNHVSPLQARYMTPFSVAPESASAPGQWGGRPRQDLVVGGGGGGGGGGRLPTTGKNIGDKWQQRQSAMISDELLTNFRSRANTQEDDGTSQQQQQQQQQPKANYAAANRGHGEEGEFKDMKEKAKLGDSLSIQPTPQHHRNQRHPVLSAESHQSTERRKGLGSEEGIDLTAAEKTPDGVSGQDKAAAAAAAAAAAKYVNINYIDKAKRKQGKSSKYTNLPF